MCSLRRLPVTSAAETLQSAIAGGHLDGDHDSRAICGFGLDSSDIGFRPELFTDMYLEGEKRGVRRTAHGGEESDPTYIFVLLKVCPLSNVCLQVVDDVAQLSIKRFLDEGFRFSINSDDPAKFGGYILNNCGAVQEVFGISVGQWRIIAENSIQGSWMGEKRMSELMSAVAQVVEKHKQ
ncbi:Adenine deaminase [Colletotrichum fructicola Nara gc5]|uniref:Adenosine deaminase n=1 Tax=Colletotrichum fructicola (strain Nara gc5) TaxID=1213859 RepID=L2FZ66_COLFN|nr:Adenine deaminase [Colletotrichum fructicola Nara gc5]KAF4881464.1 Adenine deaminase [Colletotrichum fructicola]